MYEIWKPVPSVPGMFASSFGRIVSKPFWQRMPNGGKCLVSPKPTFGYAAATTGLAGYRMIIRISRLKKTFKIHQLVCEAFHGIKPFDGAVVMHIDDNPGNNTPCNLKWATQKENLNSEQFIAYCKTRTGDNSPTRKALLRDSH